MKKNYAIYLMDILSAIVEIEEFTKDMAFEDFQNNVMAIRAVTMDLSIIGEAVKDKHIPRNIKRKYPQLPWKMMNKARNIIIHEYSGIKIKDVWDTIKLELPPIKLHIQKILKDESFNPINRIS